MIEGVPTAVITENTIDQLVKGSAVQFNWNLDHHKFMVGASIDSASADYNTTQRLGFLDAKRNAYFDPQQALDAYIAANEGGEIRNNDFDGTSLTKSIYASETWSPIETLHVTGALRYNQTKVKNTLAVRESASLYDTPLHAYPAYPDTIGICPNGNCNGVPTGYHKLNLTSLLNKPATEKYSYYSLNPSLGSTWQATPNLNVFGNVAQGTRTPSVVELGCALGRRKNPDGSESVYGPGRTCSLPSGLSGDPYLPQIKATTYDIGLRGTMNKAWGLDNVEWNLGALSLIHI